MTGRMRKTFAALAVAAVVGSSPMIMRLHAQEPGHAAPQHQAARSDAGGRETTPAANSPEVNQEEKDENAIYRHSKSVAAIGRMLGMSTEAAATAFEVFNFAVLAVAIGFGLLKTLPKAFRLRTSAIQKELSEARSASEEATVRMNSVEDRLAKLDAQIVEMKAQAERDAVTEEARFKASAEEERKRILASAEQEIASTAEHARRELQRYAASLAVEQAARNLVITAETDRALVRDFAQRLGESKGGAN